MIKRRALPAVREALARQAAVALIGPRQVGKTTLAHKIADKDGAVYLDLELPSDRAKLSDPEIQNTINESYDLAGKLNLTGTPSYVTPKEVIVGAVGAASLRTRIEMARECAKAATC